jgi:hypothetical protein
LFLAVSAAVQPRLVNSARTKNSPAFPANALGTALFIAVISLILPCEIVRLEAR